MAYEESEDSKVQENDERIDSEIDRIYKNLLKNRKLKILYQEWHVGLITWCNKTLKGTLMQIWKPANILVFTWK